MGEFDAKFTLQRDRVGQRVWLATDGGWRDVGKGGGGRGGGAESNPIFSSAVYSREIIETMSCVDIAMYPTPSIQSGG